MITIAICDDDKSTIQSLKKQIYDIISYSEFNDITYRFVISSTPNDLINIAQTSSIDVLFLDIQFPEESGL